jgi:hypothetical protein
MSFKRNISVIGYKRHGGYNYVGGNLSAAKTIDLVNAKYNPIINHPSRIKTL